MKMITVSAVTGRVGNWFFCVLLLVQDLVE